MPLRVAVAPLSDRALLMFSLLIISVAAADDPFDPPLLNQNNVYGCQPGQSTGSIHFLGKCGSAEACEGLCKAVARDACLTWTWHDNTTEPAYRTMCYGRTDSQWPPVPLGV